MSQAVTSSKEGAKKWSPVPGVLVLPTGKEGTRLYPLVMRMFGIYYESKHPELGGAWCEGGQYFPVVEYDHDIDPALRERAGMNNPLRPLEEVEEWEKDMRRSRVKKANRSQDKREVALVQVFSEFLSILTDAGIGLLHSL